MRKLLINLTLISSFSLVGCSTDNMISLSDVDVVTWDIPGIYRIPIRQGNLITQQMVNELKPGMTKQQVRFLLGTPLIQDTFHEDRWDYLYRYKPGSYTANTEVETQRIQLHFKEDQLSEIVGDLYPESEELAKITKEKERETTLLIPKDAPREFDEKGFFGGLWDTVRGKNDDPVIVNSEPKTEEVKSE